MAIDPISLITSILSLVGSGLSSKFGGDEQQQESPIQGQQRDIIDELMLGLQGTGPFASLFQSNFEDFEKGFADPARSRFQNQTIPQIQQSFIQTGQQRGTGLEDTLTRAGVDLESLINENFLNFQQGGQNRASNAIGDILGAGPGVQPQQQSTFGQGVAGFLGGDQFGESLENIFAGLRNPENQARQEARRGFKKDRS